MKIVFLKEHTNYKAGNVVENHPNTNYLLRCGVAKEVVEEVIEEVVEDKKPIKKNGKL